MPSCASNMYFLLENYTLPKYRSLDVEGECIQCGNCCLKSRRMRYETCGEGISYIRIDWDVEEILRTSFDLETKTCLRHDDPRMPKSVFCSKWPWFPEDIKAVGCKGFRLKFEYQVSTG